MANIHETISEVAKLNPELARQIQKYVKDHSYGLVFENNLPEAVRLYKKTVCTGDVVNILPPRGQFDTEENSVPWVVKSVKDGVATLQHDDETKAVPVEDVVVTVSYRDVIYPGLKEIDRIERGNPDDPYHMVINAENYHALEALTYAYAGKVDCIYIDPPYNKENSHDWKYNCNYVDGNDQYRHSKWLAMMERRLKLAKQLLNPKTGVLIVTIDEVEVHRLYLLLEQLFPEFYTQMVTYVSNPTGSTQGRFSRIEEHAIYCFAVDAYVNNCSDPMIGEDKEEKTVRWKGLLRSGTSAQRVDRQNMFYPVFVDADKGIVVSTGPALPFEQEPSFDPVDGYEVAWPIRSDGSYGRWSVGSDTLKRLIAKGYVQLGQYDPKRRTYGISYISSETEKQIDNGSIIITGRDENTGVVNVEYKDVHNQAVRTVWNRKRHNAGVYGTNLITDILGKDNSFSFPKSLYATHDSLLTVIKDNKDALVVDFFAGSGTTLHAVNLLNAEDGGHRRCICVTNNEVPENRKGGEHNAKDMTEAGLRPSDSDWEKYGIANYVTWPRTKCAIEGVDIYGKPLEGNYIGSDIPMADGFKANAIFCELTYESAWPIRLDNAFDAIAPILWMQAGCRGPIIRRIGKSYLTTDYYGVLFDYNQASKFCDKVKNTPSIKTVFVVTDDQRRYSNMCRRLPGIEVHRLYETYLRTFEICGEGGLD